MLTNVKVRNGAQYECDLREYFWGVRRDKGQSQNYWVCALWEYCGGGSINVTSHCLIVAGNKFCDTLRYNKEPAVLTLWYKNIDKIKKWMQNATFCV